MGYPKKYVGHYPNLASWLLTQGHAVYPMEMFCEPVRVYNKEPSWFYKNGQPHYDYHDLYGCVDVISMFGNKIWAWEYKSKNDSLRRGLKQLANYAKAFDYVCLVAEKPPINEIYEEYLALGAGVYHVLKGCNIEMLDAPELKAPNSILHDKLLTRFRRYVFPNEHAKTQRMLMDKEKREEFLRHHKPLTEYMGAVNLA